ncbi:PEP-CTERM sorting domain-containing protein [Tunturiibacter lichenicola]|uniref:PEP-CTERM sorting domain-containing protein n=1 Tax=Tunturiibacter lichenicola TaxID=2051959 RepID=UPI0021B42D1B|nr:PEP-CTERM sorting domain-containing protein [Edaphobacter lichenicola]
MHLKKTHILPLVLALGVATAAKADPETFPFTYTTTGSGAQITASGSFVTDGYSSIGNNLAPSDITSWNITFTSPSFVGASFVLDPSDSTLSIANGTEIAAFANPNNLLFEASNYGEGFDLTGTVQFGQDQDKVEWLWVDGAPSSTIWVKNSNGTVNVIGTDHEGNLPVLFETADNTGLGTSPAPTPEPSSLILFGTGSLAFAAAGMRKLRSTRHVQGS